MYSELFFSILLYGSLFSLIGVFAFQIYYFIKDIKNKTFWK